MYQPTFRGATDRRIEVLIAYDDEALCARTLTVKVHAHLHLLTVRAIFR